MEDILCFANEISIASFDQVHEKEVDDERDNLSLHDRVDSVMSLTEINRAFFPLNGNLFTSISWNDRLRAKISLNKDELKRYSRSSTCPGRSGHERG